jgi:alcohol dehydrogenase YqhD (iron-dependent ADH family)
MENFVFHNPTRIFFGKSILKQLGTEVAKKSRRVLFLYGKGSIKQNGVFEQIIDTLKDNNLFFVEYSGIKPNPLLCDVRKAISICKEENLDSIVAVGGGSVLDSAKAIAAGALFQNDIWDCFGPQKKYTILDAIPIYNVLTISATGSEMNPTAVITNDETNEKLSFYSDAVYPLASFIDPDIQKSLPRKQTIFGAIDIICHVMENYFNGISGTDIQDYLAEGIMKVIIEKTPLLLENPDDYQARAQFAWAGTLALNGLNSAGRDVGDWSTHRIGHAISAMFDFSHGLTLAIVLPAWMKYCYKNDVEKFARFGREIFHLSGDNEKVAIEGIFKFQQWIQDMSIKTSLIDNGIRIDEIDKIAINSSIPYPLGKLKILKEEDVKNILHLSNY